MSLADQLTERRTASAQNLPSDVHAAMMNATKFLKESGIEDAAPKAGEKLLSFELPNQNGDRRKLEDLLQNGPLVITFYRGGWCPYCNMELRAFQLELDAIKAAGAGLVAITPELPDASLSTTEKNELGFEVLSDVNSAYARELGLVFTLAEELRPIYKSFGIEVEQHNGEGQFDLPLSATFIVNSDGTIKSAFVDADYTYRQEPSEVVKALG
ncbi:peroxiredoxin-like family protein [Kiloniella sp. b19]|uniref:peroxiredoxin-like family protein n=1 Tax=Kiloniella sp. GXU_MW_B19 TaxID=3141326 RepID=UPI0031E0714A